MSPRLAPLFAFGIPRIDSGNEDGVINGVDGPEDEPSDEVEDKAGS